MKKFILLSGLLFSFLFLGFFLLHPFKLNSASLTNASATLSNSRLSYSGQVDVGASAGVTAINIKTSGNIADTNTNHIFPKDTISVGPNGNLTVASVVDSNTFMVGVGLSAPASDGDAIYATQSGTLTVAFTTTYAIPADGDVIVTIPDPATNQNDGAPDTADSTANNGFDFNTITTANITCPTGANWSKTSATAGSGSGHTVICTTDTEVAASSALTVVVGDGTKGLINPAPIYSGHTQGLADTYTISVTTRDSGDLTIDDVNAKVAPVEAVLVSATVDQTLTFQVQGLSTGSTACGQATDVTTTAYSVPWGTLSIADSFKEAGQQLTVSTNADGGYTVKIEENDQMGKNGGTCTGTSPSADGFTFGSTVCIRDTVCGTDACTESAARDWTSASSYQGLGISLQDVDGTDAVWDYDGKAAETTCTSGTFCARQIADLTQGGETAATIMSNSDPVSSKDIYTCYRIAISATQPAGYYYNKVKYTATATF